jgi:hypothetical protein
MTYPQSEQRAARRFALQLPISVQYDERNIETQTRDISARGVSFYIDLPFEPGTPITLMMTLPPEITHSEALRVRCFGRVVRCGSQEANGERVLVAAVLERYEFLASAEA